MAFRPRWSQLKPVLWDTRYVVGFFLSLVLPILLLALLRVDVAKAARYAGLFWELLGVGVVANGVMDTHRRFGRPGVQVALREWFERLKVAFGKPRSIALEGAGAAFGISGATADLKVGRNRNRPLEDRVAALELDFDALRDHVEGRDKHVMSEFKRLDGALDEERSQREQAVKSLHHTIEDVAAGGLTLEAVGLVWLLCGLFAANLSEEIARWLP
jgi:hypothetical protein